MQQLTGELLTTVQWPLITKIATKHWAFGTFQFYTRWSRSRKIYSSSCISFNSRLITRPCWSYYWNDTEYRKLYDNC